MISPGNELSFELSAHAKSGDLVLLNEVLDKANTLTPKDQKTFGALAINALWRACEQGHLACAKTVAEHPLFEDQDHMLHGLLEALKAGHEDVVKWILPRCHLEKVNPFHQKMALLNAVMSGKMELVTLILPFVPKKAARTEALRMACELKLQDIFDHLYPLSNPEQALKYMKERKTLSDEDRALLEQVMKAKKDHAAISSAVDELDEAPRRSPKM